MSLDSPADERAGAGVGAGVGQGVGADVGERPDAIDRYVGARAGGALTRAITPGGRLPDDHGGAGLRVASAVLRGGLTGWVRVGMLVRRLRGRSDPLDGLGQRDTFAALCRLVQASVEARPLGDLPPGAGGGGHVRLYVTQMPADVALPRIEQVLGPYAVAGTLTRTGRAVIAWFAIRHLIATRAADYSLQVVHFTHDDGTCQLSLMLPRDPAEEAQPPQPGAAGALPERATPVGSRRRRRAAENEAAALAANGAEPGRSGPPDQSGQSGQSGRSGQPGQSGQPAAVVDRGVLQAYLDAYREYLTRELLLEPVVASGSVTQFAWVPEQTADGGVAVAGTVPGALDRGVVLRMAAHALAQLGERSRDSAGRPLGEPEPDGPLLVQRWAVGPGDGYVLSVAARTGDRQRPTQVLIHFATARRLVARPTDVVAAPEDVVAQPVHVIPRTGSEVDEARALALIPLWWHSADARLDGNDVILYQMPFRGRKLRVRANDYPAEPMYTLLVGEPGAEVAAVDLEDWPMSWVRPRTF